VVLLGGRDESVSGDGGLLSMAEANSISSPTSMVSVSETSSIDVGDSSWVT
jgi:hypothetical protein